MDYKKLTVFNYQISYYAVRIFTFIWLFEQISYFKIYRLREPEFYNPTVWIQQWLFPIFPSPYYFGGLCLLLFILLLLGLFRQKYWITIATFVLVLLVNLPIAGYRGMGHHSHVLILFYFFSIFLLPKNFLPKDYKYVQYLYLGILGTYSLAGIWKLLSMGKDFISKSPDLSWYERNAALINTKYNYYIIDREIPDWMASLYQYEMLWIVITVVGVIFQTICFLGAFNRRFLTFTLLYLLSFHLYTKVFVIADWKSIIYGLIFIFFPYHLFYEFFKKNRWIRSRTI